MKHDQAPISYTEFKRRFDAANAEVNGQKVLLKKDASEPTAAEFAKQRSVMERHGIVDFDLSWDAVARRFVLEAKSPEPELSHVTNAKRRAAADRQREGWCRKCGWDSKDARCPIEHPAACDGVT